MNVCVVICVVMGKLFNEAFKLLHAAFGNNTLAQKTLQYSARTPTQHNRRSGVNASDVS
jgi:hypothetical protein